MLGFQRDDDNGVEMMARSCYLWVHRVLFITQVNVSRELDIEDFVCILFW